MGNLSSTPRTYKIWYHRNEYTEQTIKLGEEMQIENNEIIFVLLQLHISNRYGWFMVGLTVSENIEATKN